MTMPPRRPAYGQAPLYGGQQQQQWWHRPPYFTPQPPYVDYRQQYDYGRDRYWGSYGGAYTLPPYNYGRRTMSEVKRPPPVMWPQRVPYQSSNYMAPMSPYEPPYYRYYAEPHRSPYLNATWDYPQAALQPPLRTSATYTTPRVQRYAQAAPSGASIPPYVTPFRRQPTFNARTAQPPVQRQSPVMVPTTTVNRTKGVPVYTAEPAMSSGSVTPASTTSLSESETASATCSLTDSSDSRPLQRREADKNRSRLRDELESQQNKLHSVRTRMEHLRDMLPRNASFDSDIKRSEVIQDEIQAREQGGQREQPQEDEDQEDQSRVVLDEDEDEDEEDYRPAAEVEDEDEDEDEGNAADNDETRDEDLDEEDREVQEHAEDEEPSEGVVERQAADDAEDSEVARLENSLRRNRERLEGLRLAIKYAKSLPLKKRRQFYQEFFTNFDDTIPEGISSESESVDRRSENIKDVDDSLLAAASTDEPLSPDQILAELDHLDAFLHARLRSTAGLRYEGFLLPLLRRLRGLDGPTLLAICKGILNALQLPEGSADDDLDAAEAAPDDDEEDDIAAAAVADDDGTDDDADGAGDISKEQMDLIAKEYNGEIIANEIFIRKLALKLLSYVTEEDDPVISPVIANQIAAFVASSAQGNLLPHEQDLPSSLGNIIDAYQGKRVSDCQDALIKDISDALYDALIYDKVIQRVGGADVADASHLRSSYHDTESVKSTETDMSHAATKGSESIPSLSDASDKELSPREDFQDNASDDEFPACVELADIKATDEVRGPSPVEQHINSEPQSQAPAVAQPQQSVVVEVDAKREEQQTESEKAAPATEEVVAETPNEPSKKQEANSEEEKKEESKPQLQSEPAVVPTAAEATATKAETEEKTEKQDEQQGEHNEEKEEGGAAAAAEQPTTEEPKVAGLEKQVAGSSESAPTEAVVPPAAEPQQPPQAN
eukprot:TRINITY_DN224_c0_g1_i4.p1 TRINITY_DN224_c0_g1~~TRINITY_DN224_c0_g1_i4.p1  ORF type:complete len:1084 (-),score=341.99 TRINITY_DN224_c0_g1_i4:76-2922(-)